MNDLAGGTVSCAIRHAPTHEHGGAGHDLGAALVQLQAEGFVERVILAIPARFNDAEKAITKLALDLGSELDGKNRIGSEGIVQQ